MKKVFMFLMLSFFATPLIYSQSESDFDTNYENSDLQISATYQEVISKTKKGSLSEYISKSGEIFKVGDTITLGIPFGNMNYSYIFQNAGVATYPLSSMSSGYEVIIKKIIAIYKRIDVNTTTPGLVYGLKIINLESALESGEIKTKLMTSDEALIKLKKEKDKLDLGLITQDEFDKKKAELSKYIK